MRLAVVVPAHCHPDIVRLTLGSLSATHANHELLLHVGVHSNWRDYCDDTSLFEDLAGIAQVHFVDELNWLGEWNDRWWRYSAMHAKNLLNLLRHAATQSWDYLLVADQDLLFKGDLAGFLASQIDDAAFVCSFLDDVKEPRFFRVESGEETLLLPKPSAWHLLATRKFVDAVVARPELIEPRLTRSMDGKAPVFADTFAVAARELGCRKLLAAELAPYVQHFWGTSFNYGQRMRGGGHVEHVERLRALYREHFPDGWPPRRSQVQKPAVPTIAFIVPTVSRPTLLRALLSILQQPDFSQDDSILVVGDGRQPNAEHLVASLVASGHRGLHYFEHGPTNMVGNAQRNYALDALSRNDVTASHVAYLDDDNVLLSGALAAIKAAIKEEPLGPLMFRVAHQGGRVLGFDRKLECGSVDGHCIVHPNIEGRVGRWTGRYEADFDFISDTVGKWGGHVRWRDEVIIRLRPPTH